jgi:vancomycin resistance protein YoaR
VHLLAQIIDGTIVKPGQSFDFNRIVGQRTTERGFRVGQQIENGQLVPAVGGGVCQVATTLYDAAFYAGLKVTDRTNHDFYISHYALGMDATVSWGGPELRFVNTLEHAILIRFAYTDSTLSIQLFSTPEGLTVEKETGPQHDFTSASTTEIDDPTLPPGTRTEEGGGAGGFSVTVFRTVKRKGKVIRRDTFTSVYHPQDVIVRVGPPKPKGGKQSKDGEPADTATPAA